MQFKFQTQVKKWELNWYDLIDLISPKTICRTIGKNIAWLKKFKTMYFFKKYIETTTYWIDLGQFGLTF